MMIAIEGMDGVGKTTIAKHISEKYDFKFVEKPVHYFYSDGEKNNYENFMEVARKVYDINDKAIKSWYFGLGNIYVSRLMANENIVVDRHLVSNYYWNGDLESETIYKSLIELSGTPDLTILLYATTETRMERLKKRNPEDPDLTDPDKKDDGYDKMLYFVEKFEQPYILINTEGKSIDEVQQIVDQSVDELLKKPKQFIKKDNK